MEFDNKEYEKVLGCWSYIYVVSIIPKNNLLNCETATTLVKNHSDLEVRKHLTQQSKGAGTAKAFRSDYIHLLTSVTFPSVLQPPSQADLSQILPQIYLQVFAWTFALAQHRFLPETIISVWSIQPLSVKKEEFCLRPSQMG